MSILWHHCKPMWRLLKTSLPIRLNFLRPNHFLFILIRFRQQFVFCRDIFVDLILKLTVISIRCFFVVGILITLARVLVVFSKARVSFFFNSAASFFLAAASFFFRLASYFFTSTQFCFGIPKHPHPYTGSLAGETITKSRTLPTIVVSAVPNSSTKFFFTRIALALASFKFNFAPEPFSLALANFQQGS